MAALLAGAAWLALVALALIRASRQGAAFQSIRRRDLEAAGPDPEVAVIVPVRDEAAVIEDCLRSLLAQSYSADRLLVVVVDDASSDGTDKILRDLAAEEPRLQVRDAGALPTRWLGKPHACWQGAKDQGAEWLCFIDADVSTAPDLIASAVAEARAGPIDMLSLHPFLELTGFWGRVTIPAGAVILACTKEDRGRDAACANEADTNGQFLLVRRRAYAAVGGHRAVRGEVCEDLALARRIKRAGFRFRVLSARELAWTRMYANLPDLWQGFSKNAVTMMGGRTRTTVIAAAALLFPILFLGLPTTLLVVALTGGGWQAELGLALSLTADLAVLGLQIGTVRYFRLPLWYALALPLGYVMAACIALNSLRLARLGRVTWKRRHYTTAH